MTSELPGKELTAQVALLMQWMEERERVRELKEAGASKPWSEDPIFQTTYFCNVHREDDRVTRWIRQATSPFVKDEWFEVNIGLCRIINRISTIECIFPFTGDYHQLEVELTDLMLRGQTVFGDAYIVSTNGRAMPKAQYICEYLLPALWEGVGPGGRLGPYPVYPTLSARFQGLRSIYGLGSFMAGQILADLKNTVGHPLYTASDKDTWACAGPGSLRGLGWIQHGNDKPISASRFMEAITLVREILYEDLKCEIQVDMQDLQNCLCEFDKYQRIKNGVGRSKRKYPGAA